MKETDGLEYNLYEVCGGGDDDINNNNRSGRDKKTD